ncbi:hypothetical protein Sfr7A_25185 [Streptomyces xinghaiensis]|uniref:Uncharacterized protein n=1 Tax=Streptomyces xinghaiensis TaxID=1038928 RepID=A0A3S5IL77_9ACTN|nr:hypothetical protein Sfr7A_25185 [Streptomyces xinghaiensis]RKM95797.1 hypothetical protein SFRA_012140 [Streptomyces xinghaiensis]RNC70777.1 hypothetical protein DC095_023915 [Streptomyces xinghaiensis]
MRAPERLGTDGRPGGGGAGCRDPGIRGSGDPGIRGSGDPGIRGSGDPGIRGSGDPGIRGSGDPGHGSTASGVRPPGHRLSEARGRMTAMGSEPSGRRYGLSGDGRGCGP